MISLVNAQPKRSVEAIEKHCVILCQNGRFDMIPDVRGQFSDPSSPRPFFHTPSPFMLVLALFGF